MKKKLKKFALVAEIISAFAVVAGLIFVGLEIRQSTDQAALNTRALETAAYQDLIAQILQINTVTLADTELLFIVQSNRDEALTDPIEIAKYQNYAINVARHEDMACFQFQQELISEDRLVSAMSIFINVVWARENEREYIRNVLNSAPGLEDCIDRVLPYFE
jgi:hypothetical protein